jgi:photosystem II stability/assembly factor-like uncharacterized protein
MTQEPRHEVEVLGAVGEPVPLPVGTVSTDGATPYAWTVELPPEVEAVDPPDATGTPGTADAGAGWLLVRAAQPGSYLLLATLADPRSPTPMTVLPIRLTVS